MKHLDDFKSFEDQIHQIDLEISKLQGQKSKLVKMMMGSEGEIDDEIFLKKFKIWYDNNDPASHKSFISDIPRDSLFRTTMMDKMEANRHETVSLEDIIGPDDWYLLFYDEDSTEYKDEKEKVTKEYIPLFKECMKNNVKSVVFDW